MDWATPLEAIRKALAAAAELPDRVVPASGNAIRAVEWSNRKSNPGWNKGQWINLTAPGIVGIGRDETRYDLDDPTDPLDPTTDALVPVVMGNRQVTVQLMVMSDSQEPDKTAQIVAERVRTGLKRPSVKAIFRAGGVGFSHVEFSVQHDYRDGDDRWFSQAVMEVVFLVAVNTRDEATGEGVNAYVKTVEATGTFTDSVTDPTTVAVAVDAAVAP